jgi:hypothetical protein
MGNNKGRRGVDGSDGDTLSGIDRILAEMSVVEIQPGEFTAHDLVEGLKLRAGTIAKRLTLKVDKGELLSRTIVANGTKMRVYRYPD